MSDRTTDSLETIAWALDAYPEIKMTTGLNISGTVLLDLAHRSGFTGELLFVDTGYHFPQTIALWERLDAMYPNVSFNLLGAGNDYTTLHQSDPIRCCEINKVAPLNDYLATSKPRALLNARTRESAPGRKDLAVVEEGSPIKVNPILEWSRMELEAYVAERELPEHELYADGFLSMGCWPCTRAVKPGEDPRAGRFVGQGRTECGIWGDLAVIDPVRSPTNAASD